MTIKLSVLFTFFFVIFKVPALAQETVAQSKGSEFDYLTTVMVLVLIISIVVLVIAIYLLYIVRLLLQKTQVAVEDKQQKSEKGVWSQLCAKMTRAVPVAEEESILLDHNYDGIKELDNHLPPWWTGLFYFTIVFGVIYLFVYHIIKPEWAPLQHEAYALEIQLFEEQRSQMANFIDENNVMLATLVEDLENGKQIFINNCAACHRPDGGGSIGPNLTDAYWIHGNSIEELFKVVKYGVTGKMVAWESALSGKDMRDVASYVLSNLGGTNPENAKAPEGDLITPEDSVETDTIQGKPMAALMK